MNHEQKRNVIPIILNRYFETEKYEGFFDKLLENTNLVRQIFSEQYKNEVYTYGNSFEEISLFLESASNQDIEIIYNICLGISIEEKKKEQDAYLKSRMIDLFNNYLEVKLNGEKYTLEKLNDGNFIEEFEYEKLYQDDEFREELEMEYELGNEYEELFQDEKFLEEFFDELANTE